MASSLDKLAAAPHEVMIQVGQRWPALMMVKSRLDRKTVGVWTQEMSIEGIKGGGDARRLRQPEGSGKSGRRGASAAPVPPGTLGGGVPGGEPILFVVPSAVGVTRPVDAKRRRVPALATASRGRQGTSEGCVTKTGDGTRDWSATDGLGRSISYACRTHIVAVWVSGPIVYVPDV